MFISPFYKTWNIIQDTGATHVDEDKEDLGLLMDRQHHGKYGPCFEKLYYPLQTAL